MKRGGKILILVAFTFINCPSLFAEYTQELKHGFYADKEFVSAQTLILDEVLNKRIEEIGNKIVKISAKPDIKYTFRLINDPTINAYSAAGGFVYINTGLLDILENTDELAAIIAHEVAHISKSHQIEFICAMERTKTTGKIFGTLLSSALAVGSVVAMQAILPAPAPPSVYGPTFYPYSSLIDQAANFGGMLGGRISAEMAIAMIKGYGKKQELDADALAVQYTKKAGYDPNALVCVFKRLMVIRDKLNVDKKTYLSRLINAEPGLEARVKQIEELLVERK